MKFYIFFITVFFSLITVAQLPDGFVYVEDLIPDLQSDLRYSSSNNFVGIPVEGYKNNRVILTAAAAKALVLVQEELAKQNKCLRVYDGYRPQRAVNHFMQWAKKLNDTINKQPFYPDVNKVDLFDEGYIAKRSGHSRGSTLDVTLVDAATNKVLDMGSVYDFFGKESWTNYDAITNEQKANRQLLLNVMQQFGFVNFYKEWWHYTLKNEPFPDTYFDFLVE